MAARDGQFDPSGLTPNDLIREQRVAFTYNYARQMLKWAADVRQVEVQGTPRVRTFEVRSQSQFIF